MYAKLEDLAAVKKKILAISNPPANVVCPIALGGRKLTGVLASGGLGVGSERLGFQPHHSCVIGLRVQKLRALSLPRAYEDCKFRCLILSTLYKLSYCNVIRSLKR